MVKQTSDGRVHFGRACDNTHDTLFSSSRVHLPLSTQCQAWPRDSGLAALAHRSLFLLALERFPRPAVYLEECLRCTRKTFMGVLHPSDLWRPKWRLRGPWKTKHSKTCWRGHTDSSFRRSTASPHMTNPSEQHHHFLPPHSTLHLLVSTGDLEPHRVQLQGAVSSGHRVTEQTHGRTSNA